MTMTPEVEVAIQELRDNYAEATVDAVADGDGGAYITVDPVDLGPKYEPRTCWIKFHITVQYPASDVYPHFLPSEVKRVEGTFQVGTPLGVGSAQGSFVFHGQQQAAIQLSRRSNRLDSSRDTAALKLEKVLDWLRRA